MTAQYIPTVAELSGGRFCRVDNAGPASVYYNKDLGCAVQVSPSSHREEYIETDKSEDCIRSLSDIDTIFWDVKACVYSEQDISKVAKQVIIHELDDSLIYCYPGMITLDGIERKCPNFVFSVLKGHTIFFNGVNKTNSNTVTSGVSTNSINIALAPPEYNGETYESFDRVAQNNMHRDMHYAIVGLVSAIIAIAGYGLKKLRSMQRDVQIEVVEELTNSRL